MSKSQSRRPRVKAQIGLRPGICKPGNETAVPEENVPTEEQADQIVAVAEDPWVHRAARLRCRTCMWFVAKQGCYPPASRSNVGRCRRNAPLARIGYPVVFDSDWCGDFKLDESKL